MAFFSTFRSVIAPSLAAPISIQPYIAPLVPSGIDPDPVPILPVGTDPNVATGGVYVPVETIARPADPNVATGGAYVPVEPDTRPAIVSGGASLDTVPQTTPVASPVALPPITLDLGVERGEPLPGPVNLPDPAPAPVSRLRRLLAHAFPGIVKV